LPLVRAHSRYEAIRDHLAELSRLDAPAPLFDDGRTVFALEPLGDIGEL